MTAEHTASKPAVSAHTAPRAQALDALRGLAILMMVLSGVVPAAFPAWMHHAQVPPPDLKFNPNIPGITWVDLVFPFFLFSMGAAIPLALSRRMDRGEPWWRLVLTAFQRFLLLGLFAVYVAHVQPFELKAEPGDLDWLRALAAFAALFAILARLPDAWSLPARLLVRLLGWATAAGLMYTVRLSDGARFSLEHYDIIIKILANVVLATSLVWMVTRKSWLARLGAMGFLLAIRLTTVYAGPSWVKEAWEWSPAPWLYSAGMFMYLFITLPGTMVGDMLLEWMKARPKAEGKEERRNFAVLAVASFALTPLMLWGLYSRHVPLTAAATAVLCAGALWLTANPKRPLERLLRGLATLGTWCLALGLLFEPYEGGIKKDPATMSYYFVTAGLACFLLIAFTVLLDIFKGRRAVSLLIDNGQNPMVAYVGLAILVQPVLFLTRINPLINRWTGEDPVRQFLHGAAATLLLALVVSAFTRARLFWRT